MAYSLQFYMWPKPPVPGNVFITKEGDNTEVADTERSVGYTVSPGSHFIMHFSEFQKTSHSGRTFDGKTIRFSGMERYF